MICLTYVSTEVTAGRVCSDLKEIAFLTAGCFLLVIAKIIVDEN